MIPADHITFNDDGTAWLVFNVIAPLYDPWSPLDRPCDTCGGEGILIHSVENNWMKCPAQCINGRHTFDIEVALPTHDDPNCRCWACHDRSRTYRVSIVPGMVLPIKNTYEGRGAIYMMRNDTPFIATQAAVDDVTLPPAAAPGMWAVQLKVAS